jgi:serine/threonine protein phosphatase PrpC
VRENIFSFSATEIGYNHLKAEPSKVCEDASGYYDDEMMHICVVADGHGSDNYPRTERGAQFAVDAALGQIKACIEVIYNQNISKQEHQALISELLDSKIDEKHLLKYLAKNILMKWHELVEKDVAQNPFREEEMANVSDKYKTKYLSVNESERRVEKAYGCTLIAYAVTEEFSFGMQIGDGKCVVIDGDGTFAEPIPWDENCQLNVTTSICDSDAADEFRFAVSKHKPAAVFCGSDGIDDSYASTEELYALYRSILKIFLEHGKEVGESEIKEYLPILTKRGSGDDVSIALIIDYQRLELLTPFFEVQAELFDLTNLLKEKQHSVLVNEEKDKTLNAKISNISGEINALRLQRKQLLKDISEIQSKIDNLTAKLSELPEAAKKITVMQEKKNVLRELRNCEELQKTDSEKHNVRSENNEVPVRIVLSEKKVSIPEQVEQIMHIKQETHVKNVAEEGLKTLEDGTVKEG